jgi:hypothetical protein
LAEQLAHASLHLFPPRVQVGLDAGLDKVLLAHAQVVRGAGDQLFPSGETLIVTCLGIGTTVDIGRRSFPRGGERCNTPLGRRTANAECCSMK